ncbi:unnamed protein product [Mytilus edulis]|uniref:Apple domain-containing protein n=1 Tax=Mytilus edulis TaxID=6550 RepID=A0A8S3TZF7_MYTED|nr:unnamed protein product [Mytilus edulis]
MKFVRYFITSVIILLLAVPEVMYAADPEDPCPTDLGHIVADMCTNESTVEESINGYKTVDSVLLRITKHQNNCKCHGYCMQIHRNESIYDCKMNDQLNKGGTDGDWIITSGTQHTSAEECKQYCLQTKICEAVHYEYKHKYCFVYNRTTRLSQRDNAIYSKKDCVDTQKLSIRCYPPRINNPNKPAYYYRGHFHNKSRKKEEESIKDTSPSFLVALVFAIMGCTIALIFAGTTLFYKRQLLTQKSPLAPIVNYVDLSVAREVSDYSAINTQVVNEQYETVNART